MRTSTAPLALLTTLATASHVVRRHDAVSYGKRDLPMDLLSPDPFSLLANLTDYAQPITPYDFAVDGPPLELVHEIYGDFPTGIAVSPDNRLFFNLPRSSSNATNTVTVATSFNTEAPWPNASIQNCRPGQNASTCFVNVQSVVLDSTQSRLWILDTGMPPKATAPVDYGAKIWAFNVTTGAPLANYPLPPSLTRANAGRISINDVRFNLSLGPAGTAFLTDELNSLLVLDLASATYTRRLLNAPVTSPDAGFAGSFNGQPFYEWHGATRSHLAIGADGIALASGNVYFAPLASRRLYSIPQTTLANTSLSDTDLLSAVQFAGQIGSYSEGFSADDKGRVYIGTAEQSSISYFNSTAADGSIVPTPDLDVQPFVRSAYIQWADSMCVENGYLWFTTNQLPLGPTYRKDGVDLRKKPYKIFRAFVGAGPAV